MKILVFIRFICRVLCMSNNVLRELQVSLLTSLPAPLKLQLEVAMTRFFLILLIPYLQGFLKLQSFIWEKRLSQLKISSVSKLLGCFTPYFTPMKVLLPTKEFWCSIWCQANIIKYDKYYHLISIEMTRFHLPWAREFHIRVVLRGAATAAGGQDGVSAKWELGYRKKEQHHLRALISTTVATEFSRPMWAFKSFFSPWHVQLTVENFFFLSFCSFKFRHITWSDTLQFYCLQVSLIILKLLTKNRDKFATKNYIRQ